MAFRRQRSFEDDYPQVACLESRGTTFKRMTPFMILLSHDEFLAAPNP
ncbi:MAG: hypothetical protein RLZZ156_170 [Deinococcota bacterium]|jgi:hypothetical protein